MAAAGFVWPLNVKNPDGTLPEIKWVEEFQCYSVNGVLAPSPLSCAFSDHAQFVPMDTGSDHERTPKPVARERAPGSPSRVNVGVSEQATGSSNIGGESSSKPSPKSDGVHPMLFKLHKFVDRFEEYLIQVHEPTCSTTRWHKVKVYKDNKGKWAMSVVSTGPPRNHEAVQAWLEDPTPTLFEKRSDLDFQQRLVGWTVESRARKNGKEDKFYYHQGKQYKSMVRLLTFVLYANKDLKDLRLVVAPPNNAILLPHVEVAAVAQNPDN